MNTGNKMIDEIRDVILTVGCKPLVWVRPISFNQKGTNIKLNQILVHFNRLPGGDCLLVCFPYGFSFN